MSKSKHSQNQLFSNKPDNSDSELGSETGGVHDDTECDTESQDIVRAKSGKRINKTATTYIGVLAEVVYAGVNDFVIARIDKITCKGKIPDPVIGGSYSLVGEFVYNPKFLDWNFEFKSYEAKIDEERGLVQYLAKEAPGLGPVLAGKLVGLHGFKVMEILRGAGPVAGLSERQHAALQVWAKEEGTNSIFKERLYSISLSKSQVAKLLKHYGSRAEEKIRHDCFSLTEIHGFGFKTVSAIANLIGIPTYDPGRIKAAIIYAADYLIQDHGHVCLVVSEIVNEACALLGLKQEVVLPVLIQLLEEEELLVAETVRFGEYAKKLGIVLV